MRVVTIYHYIDKAFAVGDSKNDSGTTSRVVWLVSLKHYVKFVKRRGAYKDDGFNY
jgi:hypothetical protein